MFKAKILAGGLLLLMLSTQGVLAQTAGTDASSFSADVVTIYFLMLLFATIINRLLEYLKLLVLIIDRRLRVFNRLGDLIFASVKKKMDGLGIFYDAQKVRTQLRKYVLFAIMQLLAFVLGVTLAFFFKLNVLSEMASSQKPLFGYILTGLVIGAGVDPVHVFFRIVQEKRKLKKLLNQMENLSDSAS